MKEFGKGGGGSIDNVIDSLFTEKALIQAAVGAAVGLVLAYGLGAALQGAKASVQIAANLSVLGLGAFTMAEVFYAGKVPGLNIAGTVIRFASLVYAFPVYVATFVPIGDYVSGANDNWLDAMPWAV